jgi:tRNA A-37 threonylcarbamoyl transferase component Bud32
MSGQSGSLVQFVQNPATSGGLATLAGIPAVMSGGSGGSRFAGEGMRTAGSSSDTASISNSGSAAFLPELQAHVAAMDAGMSVGNVLAGHEGVGGDLLTELSLLAPNSLPEALRDVVVDLAELQPLRWPNGALQELGSGGSATVYKVLFRGEAVAAKEMEVGRDLANQRAFIAEAERLHALRHAHLVPLYGVCLSGSKGILLLEFCAGRDLHSALAVKKQGGRGERLFGWYVRGKQVALDVAKALNYLHSRSIVHLDIKSSNVLLTATGTAKLGDVGLARMQRGTALSCAPKAVGTFDYMAPEMITNSRCTLAVDLFSMGILLWEICTGERPRRGDMRLPRVPEECPQEVADLISQCMALEPGERPTAQQLMKRLQDLLTHNGHQPASPPKAAPAGAAAAAAGAAAAAAANGPSAQPAAAANGASA